MRLQTGIGKEETAAFNARRLMEPSTVQVTAQLKADLPPPKVCRTFCCSGVWRKDQVLLLKTPSLSQISG